MNERRIIEHLKEGGVVGFRVPSEEEGGFAAVHRYVDELEKEAGQRIARAQFIGFETSLQCWIEGVCPENPVDAGFLRSPNQK